MVRPNNYAKARARIISRVMSNTQVIGGTHADTGRRMEVIVSMDETNSPSDLIAIIQGLDNVELSLLALAEAMAVTSIRYGQAMARIIGCPNFRSRFKSSKIEVLTFDHLIQQYPDQQTPIQFEMLHRSKLDPSLCKDDSVHFTGMEGPPYFMGDYKRPHPRGLYELAATVRMRDLVWCNDQYLLVGPEYYWDQYLDHIGTRAEFRARRLETLQRLLYSQVVPATNAHLGEIVRFRYEERAMKVEMSGIKAASRVYAKDEVYVIGSQRWIVAKGMAVVFDLPVWATFKGDYLKRIHGSVVGFKRSTDPKYPWNIKIRLHLSKDNIPTWLLSKVLDSQLIQTNVEMIISEGFLSGVYSIWPVCLYQGSCVPGFSDACTHDRVVIGHVQLESQNKYQRPDKTEAEGGDKTEAEAGSDLDESLSSSAFIEEEGRRRLDPSADKVLSPLIQLHEGRARVEVFSLVPIRPADALVILGYQDELTNQVNPFPKIALSAHAACTD